MFGNYVEYGISLSSNLTGKWLESLCRCRFVPILINSVLSEFNLSLLDFIHSEMSARQSLRLDIDLCRAVNLEPFTSVQSAVRLPNQSATDT